MDAPDLLQTDGEAWYTDLTEISSSSGKTPIVEAGDPATRRRVLVISPDQVGEQMAGPAIRCWELARALSSEFDVTLAVPQASPYPCSEVHVVCYSLANERAVARLAGQADVVIVASYLVNAFPFLRTIAKPIVADIYAPFILENIEQNSRRSTAEQLTAHAYVRDVMDNLLSTGDFFLCASEKQRDFYLGMLASNGRINPLTAGEDKTLRNLIDVVPFGIRPDPPQHTRPVLKGVVPGIGADDRLLIWGGGIWDWFDPVTLLRAMAELSTIRPEVKLFFMGSNHPHPEIVPRGEMAHRTLQMAKHLNLHNRTVFFGQWSSYEDRQNYLLEADIGISLHHDNLETRFSFRTRILDYIWAGLPIVTSDGDSFGDLIRAYQLGRVVGCGDVAGVVDAILGVLDGPEAREVYRVRSSQLAEQLIWDRAAEPLRRFCRQPAIAPDRARARAAVKRQAKAHTESTRPVPSTPPLPLHRLPARAWRVLVTGGPRRLWWEAKMYLRWRLGR
ncbi:MAG: glycosyltransferase family 4 protein [Bacteroidetes bacterium]|nr:glycosyltransferase family 4 protein [Bacteroidota bacterium]MCL5026733.1 glycosyltransferase family 4 protein [Chloroflexota bacterium]